jgi:hypothetical protein
MFYLEAVVHYSSGYKSSQKEEKPLMEIPLIDGFSIYVPHKKEAIRMALSILFFSTLSGMISSLIFHKKPLC